MGKEQKIVYSAPQSGRSVEVESALLAGSMAAATIDIQSLGQDKGYYFEDASSTGGGSFNSEWE